LAALLVRGGRIVRERLLRSMEKWKVYMSSKVVFDWYAKPILNGMVYLDGMVQIEHLVSYTDSLYKMIHNFVWLDE
jgi:hypothetical protein